MYSIMVLFEVESFGFNVILSSLLGQSFFSWLLSLGWQLGVCSEKGSGAMHSTAAWVLAGMVQMNILKYKRDKIDTFLGHNHPLRIAGFLHLSCNLLKKSL